MAGRKNKEAREKAIEDHRAVSKSPPSISVFLGVMRHAPIISIVMKGIQWEVPKSVILCRILYLVVVPLESWKFHSHPQ